MRSRRAVAMFVVLTAFGVGTARSAGAVDPQADPINTFTTSTKHMTTTQRTDLPDAEATECGTPATSPSLVSETSIALDPVVTTEPTIGPAVIFIGENEQTPHTVLDGEVNFNTRTTYETVVTEYFQGVAAGPPCAVVVDPRFTG